MLKGYDKSCNFKVKDAGTGEDLGIFATFEPNKDITVKNVNSSKSYILEGSSFKNAVYMSQTESIQERSITNITMTPGIMEYSVNISNVFLQFLLANYNSLAVNGYRWRYLQRSKTYSGIKDIKINKESKKLILELDSRFSCTQLHAFELKIPLTWKFKSSIRIEINPISN